MHIENVCRNAALVGKKGFTHYYVPKIELNYEFETSNGNSKVET